MASISSSCRSIMSFGATPGYSRTEAPDHPERQEVVDYLHKTFAITQVDEDNPAMIAATMDPAADRDCLVNVFGSNLAAVMGTHEIRLGVMTKPGMLRRVIAPCKH